MQMPTVEILYIRLLYSFRNRKLFTVFKEVYKIIAELGGRAV